MKITLSLFIFLCLFLSCLSKPAEKSVKKGKGGEKNDSKPKSGPFFANLIRTEKCPHTTRPYQKHPVATFYSELYNTSKKHNLFRGNFTVLKDNTNRFLVSLKGFFWPDGAKGWQLKYYFTNIGCSGALMSILSAALGIDVNKSCMIPKGVYNFENMDYNQFEHMIWAAKREYGRWMWRNEAIAKDGLMMCWENEVVIQPE